MKNLHVEYWQGRVDDKLELIKEAHGKIQDARWHIRNTRVDKAEKSLLEATKILNEAWE